MENGFVFDSLNAELFKIILKIIQQRFRNSNFVYPQCTNIHWVTQKVEILFYWLRFLFLIFLLGHHF